MYSHLYKRFLSHHKGIQHFSSHSHHYWPDVTREAMLEYWDDCAKYVDNKWPHFFQHKLPETQTFIANTLNLSNPKQIVFAPNTHELLFRLISCFDLRKPLRILSTDSEFHSFQRQAMRLEEWDSISVTYVPQDPIESFESRFCEALQEQAFDMVFFSHVFFNSGHLSGNLTNIVNAVPNPQTLIAVDGYHGFMAIPTDLASIENRIFYLSGGYKYAQGGEGCCFMAVPNHCQLRPLYTGWFAEFDALESSRAEEVPYSDTGFRFAGATLDLSPVYRLHASLNLFKQEGLTVNVIHAYIKDRQRLFLEHLEQLEHPYLNRTHLIYNSDRDHGHFLTYRLPTAQIASNLQAQLEAKGVLTDCRGDRLRFGFGLYHEGEYDLEMALKND